MSSHPALSESNRKRQMRLFTFSMSLAAICLTMVAIILGASSTEDTQVRQIASSHKAPTLKMTKKLSRPFSVRISEAMDLSNDAGMMQELVGKIHVNRDMERFKFEWTLPEGVKVVRGDVSGVMAVTRKDFETRLTVSSDSKDNHKIHLKVESLDNKIIGADVAQYNTAHEDEIQESKEDLVERSKIHIEETTGQ